jgi:transcription elongation factor/antiterminator RfaH
MYSMQSLFKANEWYAVQVKGRQEIQASQVLRFKGYETLVPVYKARKRWSDRSKIVEVPLFPSYIFCRFDPEIQSRIVSTPGVTSVVGFGRGPVPVRSDEIESLKILMESGSECKSHAFFHAGEEVEVISGPLSGIRGIMVSNGKKTRIVISVQLIQGSVVVEVDEDCVAAATSHRVQHLCAS